jgi:hypothetical protein
MSRQTFFRTSIATVTCLLVSIFSGMVSAQRHKGEVFEHVREVQKRHADAFMDRAGVIGTAVGFDDRGQEAILVLLERRDVPDIPTQIEGIHVRPVVTGKIYALSFWDLWISAGWPWRGNAPAAPTGLQAVAVDSSQIDLTWTDNANDEQGFRIERKTTSSFAVIATIGANVTAYSDKNVSPSTTYTYRVRAYNRTGNSAYSAEASATTLEGALSSWWCERPVPIGVSTGHPDVTAGTIACRVKDGSNRLYVLSNNHIYANENRASIGDYVLQPGRYDGGVSPRDAVGTLAAYARIVFSRRASNVVDAAIAEVIMDHVDGKAIPRVGKSTPLSNGYVTPSSSTVDAILEQDVQKYGRSSGLTSGQVYAVSATVNVTYDTGTARFVNQILITPGDFCTGGDSGSLVVTTDGNHPVGLLFAGSSLYAVANPIDEVLSAFGVTIDGE